MKKTISLFLLQGLMTLLNVSPASSGELDSPADPTDPASALYTLEDIYFRLTTGATGSKRSGGFTEPSEGPGDVGHTTDEIMDTAPLLDDTNGASPEDVQTGKTFWGLTGGNWGKQTGTGNISSQALIPDTGQSICFDRVGTAIDCEGSGQDGEQHTGMPLPSPRFTDHGNGTVSDQLTGLIWLKNANCYGFRTWEQALGDSAGLKDGECGLSDNSVAGDWRLPNLFELESLRNMNYFDPPLSDALGTGHWSEGDPFTNVQVAQYWSSTTFANSPASAACVAFSNGNENPTGKSNTSHVWPVRGGKGE